eukprot:6492445-Lingulodinium_polyedra.AAC.1
MPRWRATNVDATFVRCNIRIPSSLHLEHVRTCVHPRSSSQRLAMRRQWQPHSIVCRRAGLRPGLVRQVKQLHCPVGQRCPELSCLGRQ